MQQLFCDGFMEQRIHPQRTEYTVKRWYVVYTRPQQEAIANIHLNRQHFETCLPLLQEPRRRNRKWQEVIVPLFPRYLFVRLQLEADNVAPIRSTRGVVGLVRFGTAIKPLPEGFVESLNQFADPKSGYHLPEKPLFTIGGLVKILEGPFKGCAGVYQKPVGNSRALLLLEFLGRTSEIVFEHDQMVPA